MAVGARRPLGHFNSCQHVFRSYDEIQARRGEQIYKKQRLLPREDYVVNPPDTHQETTGEGYLRHFEELLEYGFGIERGDFQREFHAQCTKEIAENIVGPEDWAKIGERLKRSRGWTSIRHLLMASAPRRFGKSVALSVLVAAYAVVVPQSVQCIFSTGRRASKNDLEIIYKLICDLGHKSWIVKFNEEELWLMPDPSKATDVRKVFCYPSKATISTTTATHHTRPVQPLDLFYPFIWSCRGRALLRAAWPRVAALESWATTRWALLVWPPLAQAMLVR